MPVILHFPERSNNQKPLKIFSEEINNSSITWPM